MTTPKERAALLDIGDRLIELYTSRSEAADKQDWNRLCGLQEEINRVEDRRTWLLTGTRGGEHE